MEHPKDVGDRSTLAIMLALRDRGYGVYVAFGENTRSRTWPLTMAGAFSASSARQAACETGL
jgi:hypothetical protein